MDVTVDASETSRSVTIERIWLDEARPRAGRTMPLKVLTRSYRGEEKISTVPIDIPAHASGALSILVSDGRQLNAIEQRDLRRSLQPQSVAQLMRVLNDTRRNNRIYVRLLTGTARRGRQRRGDDGAAAVGPVGDGERPQRRQLHPDPQRHRSASGSCRWGRRSPDRGSSPSTWNPGARPAADLPFLQPESARAPMLNLSGLFRRVRRLPDPPARSGARRWWPAGCLLAAAVASASLDAASATFWTVATQADFLKGDVENVSIDSDGRLFLGPSPSLVAETSAPFLWTALLGADGTLWAGSGNEGQVLRVGRDGKLSTFFDAPELEVHALAAAPQGGLYVGTSPDGRIYHVSADGTSKRLLRSGRQVHLVARRRRLRQRLRGDRRQGRHLQDRAGRKRGAVLQDQRHQRRRPRLHAEGRSDRRHRVPGPRLPLDAAGKAFVLLDSPFREIHAVRLADDGTIYAAAVNGTQGGDSRATDQPPAEPARQPVASVSTEITAITAVDNAGGGAPSALPGRSPRKSGRGAIYRIRPDGMWDAMWDTGEDSPYDIVIEPSGSLLVGTGTEGKIFRVTGDPARATLLARASARQVTALLRRAGRAHPRRRPATPASCSRSAPSGVAPRHLRVRRA